LRESYGLIRVPIEFTIEPELMYCFDYFNRVFMRHEIAFDFALSQTACHFFSFKLIPKSWK